MDGPHHVSLIGLDFGTTTSSAVVASAQLERRWASGRSDLESIEERFRSEIVFTPFRGDDIDVERAGELIDGWLAAAGALYYMDVCLNTDRMLAYFDTSGHDVQTLREIHGRTPGREFLLWALEQGIFEEREGGVIARARIGATSGAS